MNETHIRLLKQAVLNEYEGYEYYMHQSKQWHDQDVVANFEAIAREELLHVKWLEDLFAELKDPMDQRLFNLLDDVKAPGVYDWSSIKRISHTGKADVFKKAMEMELASIAHYQKLKQDAETEEVIPLFDRLIQWEKNHYQQFKTVYDELTNM